MIKINLSPNRQQMNLSNIGGIDFTKVKIKALLLVLAIMYLPDFFIVPMWQETVTQRQSELQTLKDQSAKLKQEVNKTKDFEKQIQDLKNQEQALGQKTGCS